MKNCFKKISCPICKREITEPNLSKHLRWHTKNPVDKVSYKLNHEGLECQFCGKTYPSRNSLCNHERQCKSNPNRQLYNHFNNGCRPAWNKGKHLTPEHKQNVSKALKGKKKNFSEETIQNMIKKCFETKKKNKSLNSSKSEHSIYDLLVKKYGYADVIHHYTDERYPFECDLYIKSLDLFIEINLHWTHGKRPFNSSDLSCINDLNIWKEKARESKYFRNAIDVWTRRDILKLETAKNNNLNYLTVYSLDDLDILVP